MHQSGSGGGACRIAVVVSGWPRVSETFALNELLALHERGMLAAIIATKPGPPHAVQPGVDRLSHLVQVLPDATIDEQVDTAIDIIEPLGVTAVHGYFAHAPAQIAERVADRLGVAFGFSVHALDARKVPADELGRRAEAARIVVSCNPDVDAQLAAAAPGRSVLTPHGVDCERFRPAPSIADGTRFRLLAVGRHVEKKGFRHLIEAMAATPGHVTLDIVGDGPERADLADRIDRLGLGDRVALVPTVNHDRLPRCYTACDAVVVPSVVDSAGDRDGLPNVVLEALASGCAVIASDVAAISSAITHERSGLLVPPGNATALAAAIARLAGDVELRDALGQNARALVEDRFALEDCADRFCRRLEAAYA